MSVHTKLCTPCMYNYESEHSPTSFTSYFYLNNQQTNMWTTKLTLTNISVFGKTQKFLKYTKGIYIKKRKTF